MTLWACASCGSTAMCEHRELELVAWAVSVTEATGEFLADPLPPRKPAAAETLARKAASQ